MRQLLGILAGAALGASAMYLLDPDAGAARRARLRGMAGGRRETWPPRTRHPYDTLHEDAQLRDRLRQRMGRLVSFPGAIHVQVDNHVVRLSGDVLGKELDGLLSQVRDTPGVTVIEADGGYALFDAEDPDAAQRVLAAAVARGGVSDFARQHPSLSQIFKEVVR